MRTFFFFTLRVGHVIREAIKYGYFFTKCYGVVEVLPDLFVDLSHDPGVNEVSVFVLRDLAERLEGLNVCNELHPSEVTPSVILVLGCDPESPS